MAALATRTYKDITADRCGGTHHRRALLVALLVLLPWTAHAWCFDAAGAATGTSPALLRAIAKAESGLNPRAVNDRHFSTTKTMDIGLMQINTSWLPALQRYGITTSSLYDPCTNVTVGAWILSDLIQRLGDNWDAVGAYNASCTRLGAAECRAARSRYAWRVHSRLGPVQPAATATAATAAAPAAPLAAPIRPGVHKPGGGLLAYAVKSPASATLADGRDETAVAPPPSDEPAGSPR